jgi:thiol-disulfide isomerase/thioredoxin
MGDISILQVDDEASAAKLENIHNKPNHHIVTLFYRDGCPPCDAMKPEWKKACDQFRQQYKCKDNDANERTVIANVDDKGIQYLNKVFHKIEGTPTIMYMSNKNNKRVLREYRGKKAKRTSRHFLKWIRSSLSDSVIAPIIKMNNSSNNNNNNNNNNQQSTRQTGGSSKRRSRIKRRIGSKRRSGKNRISTRRIRR